jgi:serine/threonine protein kinase
MQGAVVSRYFDGGRYLQQTILGEGTYGVVYLAVDTTTGDKVALKRMINHDTQSVGLPSVVVREIVLVKGITQHPNVLGYNRVDACTLLLTRSYIIFSLRCFARLTRTFIMELPPPAFESEIVLVFPIHGQDLAKILVAAGPAGLSPQQIIDFMRQLVSGVAHCHAHGVMHADLKPANILVDEHGSLKVADFGLARMLRDPRRVRTDTIVTLHYRPPELLQPSIDRERPGFAYGCAVDMWSVGCIFAELLSGSVWFADPHDHSCSDDDQLGRIFR